MDAEALGGGEVEKCCSSRELDTSRIPLIGFIEGLTLRSGC